MRSNSESQVASSRSTVGLGTATKSLSEETGNTDLPFAK